MYKHLLHAQTRIVSVQYVHKLWNENIIFIILLGVFFKSLRCKIMSYVELDIYRLSGALQAEHIHHLSSKLAPTSMPDEIFLLNAPVFQHAITMK